MTVVEHTSRVEPVETKPFLEVFTDKTGGNPKVQTSEYLKSGKFPIVDQGQKTIAGYSNDDSLLVTNHGPVIIFGDHTRILKYVEGPFILGADGTKVLVPRINADVRFLFHYLRFVDIPSAGYSRHFKFLKEIRIPLPLLPEQRRIAAILDKADHLRTQRREALAHLDALTHSIFNWMFGSPSELADRWNEVPLADVTVQITDGEHQTPIRTTAGIKLLSARNVQNGALDFRSVDFIGTEEYSRISKRCKPTRGDILISCSGTIGRVSMISTDEPFSLVRSVALVRPNPALVLPKFLEGQLLAPSLQAQMQRGSKSSGQANLFQAPIRKLRVILPPLELQQSFARRLAAVERLKARHRTQLAELDTLFASLQHRAFRGEL